MTKTKRVVVNNFCSPNRWRITGPNLSLPQVFFCQGTAERTYARLNERVDGGVEMEQQTWDAQKGKWVACGRAIAQQEG